MKNVHGICIQPSFPVSKDCPFIREENELIYILVFWLAYKLSISINRDVNFYK